MDQVRDRISKAYELPKGTGVFLSPSGSDAEYFALLIVKLINPGKKVVNIVTCNEEVGSGTLAAAGGRFFSPLEPFGGYHNHIEGGPKMDDPVHELADGVETVAINAREPSGDVVNPHSKIEETLKKCKEDGSVPIVHSVYGSKTGICHEYTDTYRDQIKEMNGLQVIDACQGRFDVQWLYG